jgi:DNA-binding CsgD family transcriptional regulator
MASFYFDKFGVPKLNAQILQQIFGLSPAEIKLAGVFLRGEAPRRIARELNISHETVRNQLKTIFLKTDCHRQSELAVLLLQVGQG